MSAKATVLEVQYDDGRTEEVTAGQREMAAWEREPFGCGTLVASEKSPVLFFRYLAYAALRRQRKLQVINGMPPSFDVWAADVESVEPVSDDEPDPTNQDQSKTD